MTDYELHSLNLLSAILQGLVLQVGGSQMKTPELQKGHEEIVGTWVRSSNLVLGSVRNAIVADDTQKKAQQSGG